ncbi:ABC transporter permease [Pseudoclavibacter endophyticus]|uniref:ABC transporter permease n=1 Tax=Pseudoclavibacter endophyticus TaxID=1778590 RepID=UPI001CE48165|nr:ABC transporter permease [Pseudoclavibacter endophyticus]
MSALGGRLRALALRLFGAVAVIWAVVTVTFLAVRAVPGDPVLAILGGPGSNATPEAVEQARADHGLDQPLWLQYVRYLGRVAVFDLGDSYDLRRPVTAIVGEQLPPTLGLALVALVLAWTLAVAFSWWSMRGGRVAWAIASFLEAVGTVLPHFWIATVLIAVFAVSLGLPVAVSRPGAGGLILPAVTLAIPVAGFLGQVMRERMLDTLEQPFVVAARARGLGDTQVYFRHVLRHAAVPAVATTGWAFGSLVSGAVVVETIFARPGLGRTLLDAVMIRDVPLVCGALIVVAIVYVLVTLATELAERLLDPRIAGGAGAVEPAPGGAAGPGTPGPGSVRGPADAHAPITPAGAP